MRGSIRGSSASADQTSLKYVPVKEAVRQVGKSRSTFDKYVRMLNIPLARFHVGTRGYHIAQKDVERIKQLIAEPGRISELRYPLKGEARTETTTQQERRA